jgi:hypothetical protein
MQATMPPPSFIQPRKVGGWRVSEDISKCEVGGGSRVWSCRRVTAKIDLAFVASSGMTCLDYGFQQVREALLEC